MQFLGKKLEELRSLVGKRHLEAQELQQRASQSLGL